MAVGTFDAPGRLQSGQYYFLYFTLIKILILLFNKIIINYYLGTAGVMPAVAVSDSLVAHPFEN